MIFPHVRKNICIHQNPCLMRPERGWCWSSTWPSRWSRPWPGPMTGFTHILYLYTHSCCKRLGNSKTNNAIALALVYQWHGFQQTVLRLLPLGIQEHVDGRRKHPRLGHSSMSVYTYYLYVVSKAGLYVHHSALYWNKSWKAAEKRIVKKKSRNPSYTNAWRLYRLYRLHWETCNTHRAGWTCNCESDGRRTELQTGQQLVPVCVYWIAPWTADLGDSEACGLRARFKGLDTQAVFSPRTTRSQDWVIAIHPSQLWAQSE